MRTGTPMTYAAYLPSLLRGPLAGPWGSRWLGAVGAMLDGALDGALDAGTLVGPLRAPVDALALLGEDRALEQLPSEGDADYRARLVAAWDLWTTAGTRAALEAAITQCGLAGTIYLPADWSPDNPPRAGWSQWWIYATTHPWTDDGTWGDAGTWDDGGTWDSSATPEEVARVRRLLRTWTNARDRGHVVLVFGVDHWGPESPWDNGKWTSEPAQAGAWVI